MGQVYRARDTKLQRDVAIKVLPDLFANDLERLARFEREARTLASLNHRISPTPGLGTRSTYAVSRDGRRFLFNTWDQRAALTPITLVVNWEQALKK